MFLKILAIILILSGIGGIITFFENYSFTDLILTSIFIVAGFFLFKKFKSSKPTKIKINKDKKHISYNNENYYEVANNNSYLTNLNYKKSKMIANEYVAVDVETTGLDYKTNDIIQIAAVHFENGKIINVFDSLISTKIRIPPQVTAINGITNEMLINAPSDFDVMTKFLNFIGDKLLVIHNAPFDMKFILKTFNKLGLEYKNNPVFDTLSMSRRYFSTTNHKLGTLVEELNIDATPDHSSKNDSIACGLLYEKIKIEIEKENITSKFDVARELERNEEYDSAIKIYEKALELNFDGNFPYDRLAVIYRKLKRYNDEKRVLKHAIYVFENIVPEQRADRNNKISKFKERLAKLENKYMRTIVNEQ